MPHQSEKFAFVDDMSVKQKQDWKNFTLRGWLISLLLCTINFSCRLRHKIFAKKPKETIGLSFSDTNTALQVIMM